MKTTTTHLSGKLAERVLLGTALAALLGYVGLAFSILRRERPTLICRREPPR